jgi:hypothetical protein
MQWCIKALASGVDVWSQFSAVFAPFSAKTLAFFSKTNVMIEFLQKLAVCSSSKNANIFATFFGENILKIITSVPEWTIEFRFFRTAQFLFAR